MHPAILVAQIAPVPPGIVERMRQPIVIVRSDAAQFLKLIKRQRVQHLRSSFAPCRNRLFVCFRSRHISFASNVRRDVVPDPFHPRHVPQAAGIKEILCGRKSHGRNHGLQVRRVLDRGQPLHRARIGKPKGSNRAVRPGLARCPLDGVVAVAAFVLIRTELAAGGVPPANILHHDCISVLDRMTERGVLLQCRFFAVRSAIYQHWKSARRRADAARRRAKLRRRAWVPRRLSPSRNSRRRRGLLGRGEKTDPAKQREEES